MTAFHHLSLKNETVIGNSAVIELDGQRLKVHSIDLHIEGGDVVTATLRLPVTVDADIQAMLLAPDPSVDAKVQALDVGPDDRVMITYPHRMSAEAVDQIAERLAASWEALKGRVIIADGDPQVSVLRETA